MPSEENEIPLVMESNNLATLELWHRREECLKHPTNRVAQTRSEIVENKLRKMFGRSSMAL